MKIRMRDLSNIGDDGDPFEFTRGPRSVWTYLDGAVRADLIDPEAKGPIIDDAIAHLRAGDIAAAAELTVLVGVYLEVVDDEHDHETCCCAEHGVHVTPHRGCLLR